MATKLKQLEEQLQSSLADIQANNAFQLSILTGGLGARATHGLTNQSVDSLAQQVSDLVEQQVINLSDTIASAEDRFNVLLNQTETARDAAIQARDESLVARDVILGYTRYGEWSSLTGIQISGLIVSHANQYWLLKTNTTDITTIEPSHNDLVNWYCIDSDLMRVAVAQQTPLSNVSFLSTGDSKTANYLWDSTTNTVMVAWSTITTPYIIQSYTANTHGGWDFVTDEGTFEFVTLEVYDLRKRHIITGWGAKADGSTIDRVAVQYAIDYFSNLGGGDLYLVDGVYMMDVVTYVSTDGSNYGITSIVLKDNVNIYGGRNAVFTVEDNAYGTGAFYRLFSSQNTTNRLSNVTLSGFTVDGNAENQIANTQASNIVLECMENVTVQNVRSINSNGNGIMLRGARGETDADYGKNLAILYCFVDNCTQIGIQSSQFLGLRIIGNYVSNTANNSYDVYGDNSTNTTHGGVLTITGNIAINGLSGCFLETVNRGTVTANVFLECDYGFNVNRIRGQPNGLEITGNIIESCPSGCLLSVEARGVDVSNNFFRNFTTGGIIIGTPSGTAAYVTAFSNTFYPTETTTPIIVLDGSAVNFCVGKFNKVVKVNMDPTKLVVDNTSSTNQVKFDSFITLPYQIVRDYKAYDPLFVKTTTKSGRLFNVGGNQTISIDNNTGGTITLNAYQNGIGFASWVVTFAKHLNVLVIGDITKAISTATPIDDVTVSADNTSIVVTLHATASELTWGINSTPFAKNGDLNY